MRPMRSMILILSLAGCGPATRGGSNNGPDASTVGGDSNPLGNGPDAGDDGCGGLQNCYSVYAHADHVLYQIDLSTKQLHTIGPFNAPKVGSGTTAAEDVITDLAVAPDGTIWVVSETAIYTASTTDGHVTMVGSLAACGSRGVALTFTPSGKLYTGDFKGAICEIDTTQSPPVVRSPVTLSDGMALSGDLVAVGDGTVFGTVYKVADMPGKASNLSNILATIDLTTGNVTQLGPSGYPKLFGVSFAHGKVIGFTHDGSGNVIEMDPTTGAGTVFGTFMDPATLKGISFAGAGVNALVSIIP
jgi:predicted small lipoprotein YifL